MRFIFNFIFFGFLFFLIWHFFPDAFNKLVSWADQAFIWLSNVITQLLEKVPAPTNIPEPVPAPTPVNPLPLPPSTI